MSEMVRAISHNPVHRHWPDPRLHYNIRTRLRGVLFYVVHSAKLHTENMPFFDIVTLSDWRDNSAMSKSDTPYYRHRFPPEVISHAVWLYYRFTLSFRDIEEMLAVRGIQTSVAGTSSTLPIIPWSSQ